MKSFLEWMGTREESGFFDVGQTWDTSYGVAKVKDMLGNAARFVIIEPSEEAIRGGWKKGMTFNAHPDDQTSPSPKTWRRIDAQDSKFIIMKSSRAYDNPTPLNAYRNPETCACAGVEPGRVYEDEASAQRDADKLTKCNPVGFVVVKLGNWE